MIHTEDAHIGSSPLPALLNLLGGRIEDFQKRDRAGSHAACGAHTAVFGAQAGERKSRAAAGLVYHSRVLDGVKNLFNGVTHRQHKARGKLPQIRPRIHERWRIGQELPTGHEFVKITGQLVRLAA